MEDIKKAIEELKTKAIRDQYGYYNYSSDPTYAYREGFESGLNKGTQIILSKWQGSERWRKVKDGEYPKVRDNGTSEYVLVKVPYESFHVAQYCKNSFYPNGVWFDPYVELSINVTEWKPIH